MSRVDCIYFAYGIMNPVVINLVTNKQKAALGTWGGFSYTSMVVLDNEHNNYSDMPIPSCVAAGDSARHGCLF